jgi:hypothetical protein
MRSTLNRFFILVGLAPILVTTVWCQEGHWVECTGKAAIQNITPEEARIAAFRNARRNAIEQECGIRQQAETLIHDLQLAGDFIRSISYGEVVKVDTLEQRIVIDQESVNQAPSLTYTVHLNVEVVCAAGEPDPAFKISLGLNRTVFQSGDNLVMTLRSTKDCYATILNITANDEVIVLLPNLHYTDNMIQAGFDFVFPPPGSGVNLVVNTDPGQKESVERLIFIATNEKIDFLEGLEVQNGYGFIPTQKMAVTTLAGWLSSIPLEHRAETSEIYKIVARE